MHSAVAETISIMELTAQLRALGVRRGGVLLVHASYRALRPVQGGPTGVIEALLTALGPDGTLVMPSWTGSDTEPFDPQRTPPATDLGVIADTFRQVPNVVRSNHPFAFAAAGPRAPDIVRDPLPLPPHAPASPVGRVYERDGQVLLLGVNHDADTTIHLAEVMAGVPYRVRKSITAVRDGVLQHIEYEENDHCCERFVRMDGWLREAGLQNEGRVGNGIARLARAQDIVEQAVRRLRVDPLHFLHAPSAGCAECDAARASVVFNPL
jgi:aminoglycoside N3'-acetyltransferase